MMYVEFTKNFLLADPGELKTHFGLLSPKTFDSYFLDMMYVDFMKNFLRRRFGRAIRLIFGLLSAKTFVDMMYVGSMKNFLLADSGEQMPVRLITAS